MSCDIPTITIYARGGKGNPRLLGWDYKVNQTYEDQVIVRNLRTGIDELAKASSYKEPKVITKPRTVLRIGRWITRRGIHDPFEWEIM